MRRYHLITRAAILAIFILSSCQQQASAGPRIWIDQPLNDTVFPLQPILLQAHASDSDGVEIIEFFSGNQSLIKTATGGSRMGKVIYEWQPPGEGVYTIFARATDANGNPGSPARTNITISNQVAVVTNPEISFEKPVIKQESDEEEEEDPIQLAEEMEESPAVASSQAINCRSGPDTAFEIDAVLKKDDPAEVLGRLSNNSWYLILHPQKFVECWVAASIISKSGDFSNVPVVQSPPIPQSPPPEPKAEEPEPAADTTPPTIASVQISPNPIYQNGCSSYTQTATITIEALDISGISTVQAVWSIGSESGTVVLAPAGGYTFKGTIGPINTKGTVAINGSAVDSFNNWTPFITTLVVACCIC